MKNFFKLIMFLVAYCTPIILIVVPIQVIVYAVRNFIIERKFKTTQTSKGDVPPPERNTHYGVDL